MDAVFGVLCESSLRATIMGIAVMVILRASGVKSPEVLHRAWTGVLVAMLVLPLLSLWAPRVMVPILPPLPMAVQVAAEAHPAAEAVSRSLVPGLTQAPAHPVSAAPGPPLPQAGGIGYRWGVYEIAVAAYLLGFFVLLARLLVGWRLAARLAREASGHGGPLPTDRCQAPLSVGLFHPQILLPMPSENWDSEKLGAVLAHEQEHVRRRDPLVEWLAMFNRCIHWFNPLAWWLNRKLAALAEHACDEAVLAQGYDPAGYAELLLEFARSVKRGGALVTVRGSSIHGSALAARIRRIMTTGRSPAPSRIQIAMVLAFCANAVLLPAFVTPTRTPATVPVPQGDTHRLSAAAEPAAVHDPASRQTDQAKARHPSTAARREEAPPQGALPSEGSLMQTGKESPDRGRSIDTRLAFQSQVRTDPGSPKAQDAQMKIISILMRQMRPESEDDSYAERAIQEIDKFLTLYPNSEYIPVVRQYQEALKKILSERYSRSPYVVNERSTDLAQAVVLTEAYRRWLQEDVVYIISKTESDAFLALQTDAEREHFIEQFWARRNPNPREADNPAKTEHYRRLAYANSHFACGIPGWKTDRGHTYIVNGEPDGKESHPLIGTSLENLRGGGGGTTVYPFERWRYDHFAGGGTAEYLFVDKHLDGSFPVEKYARTFGNHTLQANPIILAQSVYPLPPNADRPGSGPVTMQVTPKAGSEYLSSQFLIPYLELYNAAINQATNKPDLQIVFKVKSGTRIISTVEDSEGRSCFLSPKGVIVVGSIPLKDLAPGNYSLEVNVLDRATGQTLVAGADFTVKK